MFAINLLAGAVFIFIAVMCLKVVVQGDTTGGLDTTTAKGAFVLFGLVFYSTSATIGTYFVLQALSMI